MGVCVFARWVYVFAPWVYVFTIVFSFFYCVIINVFASTTVDALDQRQCFASGW